MFETDRITIAHLVNPAGLYGKEKWILALHAHIDTDRFNSFVIIIRNGKEREFEAALTDKGVIWYTIDSDGRFDGKCLDRIDLLIKEKRVNIVHSHGYKGDIFAWLLKRRQRIAIVSTPHGYSNAPDLKLLIYEFIDKIVLRKFDRVIPLSNQLENMLHRAGVKKMIMISNFADFSELPPSIEYDKKLVTYAGRLTWLKRVRDAIESLTFIEDVRLQIIGDGELREKLEKFAYSLGLADRVDFLGFRNNVLEYMGKSSILILPSLTEGISRITMEALAMGKPVVGTDIPGIRDIVEDGKTGLLVPVKSPRRIAEAIERLIDDTQLYDSMVINAKKAMNDRFSAAHGAKEYEKVYISLLSAK